VLGALIGAAKDGRRGEREGQEPHRG
jgi:hypothetical protein